MSGSDTDRVLAHMVRDRAERSPDLDVLTFVGSGSDGFRSPDEVRTYADLAGNANSIAAWLVGRGMDRGARFALMAANHPEFVETLIAASITGTVCVPVDPRTRGDKLAYLLHDSACRGVVCSHDALDHVLDVRRRTGLIDWVVAIPACPGVTGDHEGDGDVVAVGEVLAVRSATMGVRLAAPSDPLQIIYTSGTTGDPKGVVFPNERFGMFALTGHLFGYAVDERPYTGLSLTHGNAQAVTLAPALAMGLRAVFSRRFTKSRLWDLCRAHGATTFSLLGGMATALYSEPAEPGDADNPVRFVVSAGMPAAIWEDFERRFGVEVLEWYGAVEGGLAIKPIGQGPVGSFGRPIPGLEMRVLDEHDVECGPGVVGEICSRPVGGDASVEYHDNPGASAAKTRGGWLRSGDMGHVDDEGWFFFDHRKGGGIRRNGDFVNPGFIEKVLAEHPLVDDVFVYGVPAASGAPGESDVVAAVVAVPEVDVDVADLFARCRASLEPNFVPTYVHLVDVIPKTASEKPQARFLLESFERDLRRGSVLTET